MQAKTTLFIVVVLIIGGVIVYGLVSSREANHQARETGMINEESTASHSMADHSDSTHSGMMVTGERGFLEGMIPHHQEAVEASLSLLDKNPSPELRSLAQSIIETQMVEIDLMKEWYLDWYGEPYQNDNSYTPMMRDTSAISALVTIEQMFLEDMIEHHLGAIMMVESVRPHIERPELNEFINKIATTQLMEVEQMEQIIQTMQETTIQ